MFALESGQQSAAIEQTGFPFINAGCAVGSDPLSIA